MYRTSLSSPISGSFVPKMPGVTTRTSPQPRSVNQYRTTYNTPCQYQSRTSTSYRTPTLARKTYDYGAPSSYSSGSTTLGRSRTLPNGPGPLSSDGKTKLPNSFALRSRPSTLSKNGPVKANEDFKSSYSNYSRGTSLPKKSVYESSSSSRAGLSGLSGRRSASLMDLSGSGVIDKELSDKFDKLSTTSVSSRRYSGMYSSGLSRTSSRSKLYEPEPPEDLTPSISSHRRRASFTTRDEIRIGYDRSPEPKITANLHMDTLPRNSPISRENGTTTSSRRRDSSVDRTLSRQGSNSSLCASNNVSASHQQGGKVGLSNLGNTCFMNSIIQSLSSTKPLLEYCVNDDYHLELNKGSSNMKGALFMAYVNLMKSLWKDKNDSFVSPNNFKTQIQRFAPRFMGYQQQDAQEFLRYLLEGLHEDINRVTTKPKPAITNDDDDDDDDDDRISDTEKAKECLMGYLKTDNSKIVDIFVGQLKSELRFDHCGHRSVTFDPFWDLSLPIPKGMSTVSLQDCIGLFMKEEELNDEEKPVCCKCKARRSCRKSFSIQKFPKILVLHLKRFSQEIYRRKLSTFVDFNVTNLDLTEFAAETGGPRIVYNLFAVCNHSGGTHSGHYTAHCKHPYSNDWNYFNDSRVSIANSRDAVSAEAYVLFYELSSQNSRL